MLADAHERRIEVTQYHSIESSTLTMIAYDSDHQVLWLQFRDGNIYSYCGIPPEIYDALLSAPSKGRYFNSKIRGQFAHQHSRDNTLGSPNYDSLS
jgi:hypothetical protein